MEDTYDWSAQDRRGNVWVPGRGHQGVRAPRKGGHLRRLVGGGAGRRPRPAWRCRWASRGAGQRYREEFYAGQAEDRAQVLGTDEQAESSLGRFRHAVLIKDYSPLEPALVGVTSSMHGAWGTCSMWRYRADATAPSSGGYA